MYIDVYVLGKLTKVYIKFPENEWKLDIFNDNSSLFTFDCMFSIRILN